MSFFQSMTTGELPPLRRVVTGHDKDGVAKVLLDSQPTNAKTSPTGNVSTLIWSTDECPSDIAIGENIEDYGARIIGTAPLLMVHASRSLTSLPIAQAAFIGPRRLTMSSF